MEEILGVIFQLFFELVLNFLGEILFSRTVIDTEERKDGCGWFILFAIFGGIMGGLSLRAYPHVLLPTVALRVANLIITPLMVGWLSYLLAKSFKLPGPKDPWAHFGRGFCFALCFGIVRFVYAER